MPRVSDEEGEGEEDGDSSQENPPEVEDATPQQAPQQHRPKPGPSARGRKTPEVMTAFQTHLLSSLETAKSAEEDADRAFLLSLLPDYRQLNADEKLDFRLQSLQFFRDVRNKRRQPRIHQQPTTSYQHPEYPVPFQSHFAIHQPQQYFPAPESQTSTPLPSPAPSSSHSVQSSDFY